MKRKITFYHLDHHELHMCKNLSNLAYKNGFDYEFSNNINKKSDIGFYCLDSNYLANVKSNLSIITLGGLDQGKIVWPNLWQKENWNKFDIAFLPGNEWKKKWQLSSWDINSRPKKSMNIIGWPKTENIFSNKKFFKKDKKKIKDIINFDNHKTILYAPNREIDDKAKEVIDIVKKLGCNLIIKQFAWSQKDQKKKFRDLRNNISYSNKYAKKVLGDKVHIVDPAKNIMNYYGQADLLITDESSVIYEALLFDLPSLSISDWKMAQNNNGPKRLPVIDKSVSFTCLKVNLEKKIKEILTNSKFYKKKISKKKHHHFSYLNRSCQNFYDLIKITIDSKKNRFEVKPKYKINLIRYYKRKMILYLRILKYKLKEYF